MKSAPADRHLLILLTDASPDDSRKILPSGKIPPQPGLRRADRRGRYGGGSRPYGSRVSSGSSVHGENAAVPAANAIYGRDLARIRRMDQLAAAADG